MYIDSHAHFDLIMEKGSETEQALLDAMDTAGVRMAVQIGIDADSSRWSLDFARRHAARGIRFTVGIHPSSHAVQEDLRAVEEYAVEEPGLLFGIGECGLDYYRMRQPRDAQRESFLFQADLARRLGVPLIVHSRDAIDDTLALLRETRPPAGIMHCFSGDRDTARNVLDIGFFISFAGNVTYRNAAGLRDAAVFVPADRLLVETDAPFLTPVPLRGRPNRPDYVVHTLRFIAQLRGEAPEPLAAAISNNFKELQNHAARTIQV